MPGNPYDQFVATIVEVLAAKGIELPTIPDSAGRRAYLALLKESLYSEDQVLPVFDPKNLTGEALGVTFVALLRALESEDPEFLRTVAWIAVNSVTGRDNTNLILHTLAEKLLREFRIQIAVPDFYVGVFPTDSFNAQCRVYKGANLLLINTGCLETAEAVVASFLSYKSQDAKIQDIIGLVDRYLDKNVRPCAARLSLPGIDWGSAIVGVVLNSVEDFVVAHELGHVVQGHVQPGSVRKYTLPNEHSAELIEKSEFQEFQADFWACDQIVERALRQSSNRRELGHALAGPMIALGIGQVLEHAMRKRRRLATDGHPPAIDRIYLLQKLYQSRRVHRDTDFGLSFLDIATACSARYTGDSSSAKSSAIKLDSTFESLLAASGRKPEQTSAKQF